MTIDLAESTTNGPASETDILFILTGVAMVVFGVGLILSNPFTRRFISKLRVGDFAQTVIPDVDRYLGMRAM